MGSHLFGSIVIAVLVLALSVEGNKGQKRRELKAFVDHLESLDLLPELPDGQSHSEDQIERATRKYQRDKGLQVTGALNEETYQQTQKDQLDTFEHLKHYNYLPKLEVGKQHSESTIADGIRQYQLRNGLKVTGTITKETIKLMLKPRCGLPDILDPTAPQEFNIPGLKWDKNEITYKFVGYTRQLPQSDQRRSIRNALQKWADVTPLTFRETTSNDADILINYYTRYARDHTDGSPFDNRGGTLAHAFFPGTSSISGDTHFDDDEHWTVRSEDGTNLEIVAAHEFGHALGLGHSATRGALMQPFYSGYDPAYGLHYDDIRGVQTLYGGVRPTQPPRRATQRPARTTPRYQQPTGRPDDRQTPSDEICKLKFDDITDAHDGYLYAFRGRKAYKFNRNGVGIQRGWPKNTRKIFEKAPKNMGAAVYDSRARKLYMFKGKRYWRYTGYKRDEGYPIILKKGFYRNIEAALYNEHGEIRLLKGSQMSVWREDFLQPPQGYPIDIATRWNGVRSNLEAAVRYNRVSYFFKGSNYFKYNDRYRRVDYRRQKAGPWLGCGQQGPK